MPAPFPSFLGGSNIGGLQRLQGQLPGLFNTKPLEQSYQNLASSNLDTGRALAAAAGASYSNRAAQSGASRQGAGFAAAQAMLPIYGQNNQLMADFATKKLQAQTGQAGAGIDLSSTMAKLLAARQGMLADYSLGSQRLAQGNQQFNQDLGFRNKQLAQQGSQFQQQLWWDQDQKSPARLAQLQSLFGGSGSGGGGGGGVTRSDNFFPGFIPNAGPITPATGWINNGQRSLTASGQNVIYG